MLNDIDAKMHQELEQCRGAVEKRLGGYFTGNPSYGTLMEAMRYSLLAGGKRLRPVLCITCAGLFGLEARAVMPFAAAIECIHSYSLIHDDLPAMDDDDLRRGKPSNHKQFGEATAILAGDALLTDAFALMCAVGNNEEADPGRALRAIYIMAVAAGSSGMVGGQFMDMLFTAHKNTSLENVAKIQAGKTGALIAAACLCGAVLAGADQPQCEKIEAYGREFGQAFQIVDDILDETGDTAILGKPAGSDAARGKSTYPVLLGIEKSRVVAEEHAAKALAAIAGFDGVSAVFLRELVQYILERVS